MPRQFFLCGIARGICSYMDRVFSKARIVGGEGCGEFKAAGQADLVARAGGHDGLLVQTIGPQCASLHDGVFEVLCSSQIVQQNLKRLQGYCHLHLKCYPLQLARRLVHISQLLVPALLLFYTHLRATCPH